MTRRFTNSSDGIPRCNVRALLRLTVAEWQTLKQMAADDEVTMQRLLDRLLADGFYSKMWNRVHDCANQGGANADEPTNPTTT